MNQKTTVIIIILVLGVLVFAYFSNIHEGFQTDSPSTVDTASTSSVDLEKATPEACMVLLSMYESVKGNYIKAKDESNPYILNSLSSSLKNLEESLTKVGCLYDAAS